MQACHLDDRTIQRLLSRDLTVAEEEQALDHMAACPSCRTEMERVCSNRDEARTAPEASVTRTTPTSSRPTIPRSAYAGIVDRVSEALSREARELQSQRATVDELMAELQRGAPPHQRLMVRNSSRYHVWSLAETLLDESQRGWSDEPQRSEDLALLALEVADQLEVEGFRGRLLEDLKAEAWGYVGNSRRIRSDLYAAEEAFRSAWEHLPSGTGDAMTRARLLDLESSLQRARREFSAAEKLLLEAISIYRQVGDQHFEGRALMKAANLLQAQGKLKESVVAMQDAAELLDTDREPALTFALKKNLMLSLADLGRTEEARVMLPEIRDLAREYGNRLDRLRLRWAEGLLFIRLGQVEMAEELLRQAREGFIVAGIGYNVALISLDIAALCLESGRTAEVRELARDTYRLFTSRGVHREALASWNLFRQAAERDAVTVRLLDEVASRIRRVEGFPGDVESPS